LRIDSRARVKSYTQTETYTKDHFWQTKSMAKGNTQLPKTIYNLKANG